MHPNAFDTPAAVARPEPLHVPRPGRASAVVLALALLHGLAVWRYGGVFWSDHGRWLYIVTRFVAGEAPYRDFAYAHPPLGLLVVGGLAHLTGTSYGALSAITFFLYLLNFAVFVLALKRLTPHTVMPVAIPALLFSVALACRHGIPLPSGTDTPTGPVGFLCLQIAAWLVLETVDAPRPLRASFAGAFLALTLLSKHDFWPPALLLLVAASVLLVRRRAPRTVLAACLATFAAVLGVAIAVLIYWVGPRPVMVMLSGSGRAFEIVLRSTPSLERLVAEIAGSAALVLTAVTALWLCLAITDRTAKRWAGAMVLTFLTATAIHLGMSVAIGREMLLNGRPAAPTMTQTAFISGFETGRSVLATALGFFDDRLLAHLMPTILPPLLFVGLLFYWKRWHNQELRARVAILLGIAIVARTRRGFSGSDWYNVLLELPAYAVFIELVCGAAKQKAARAVRATLAVLIGLGAYSYVSLADGPMTFNGIRPVVGTRAGAARWTFEQARAYHYADSVIASLDPGGSRPVYALGSSGGWNYFLRRANPLPYTDGLPPGISEHVRSVAATVLLEARPFLIENRLALRRGLGPASILEWEPDLEPSRYERRDVPWFAGIASHCRPADPALDSAATIRLFDCAQATR